MRSLPSMYFALAAALATLAGCADDATDPSVPSGGAAPTPCAAGELELPDGTCQPAGLPANLACPPGELDLGDGSCQPAGVPPGGCSEGFEHDGDRGCDPVLPADPCPSGSMAAPGETACREVAPCGTGPWGEIPVEADTQFVDQSYGGGGSDGSQQSPWITIQDGVDAAAAGAIVAVAEGSYQPVLIDGKAVRLWGRCPELVEVVSDSNDAAVTVDHGADGSEVRDMALQGGDGVGLAVLRSAEVVASRVWVHDSFWALDVESWTGGASVTVTDCLIEANLGLSVFAQGAEIVLEGCVVRSTQYHAVEGFGRGIQVQAAPGDDSPSALEIRRSVFEQNDGTAIVLIGSEAVIEAVAVRDSHGGPDGHGGTGLALDPSSEPTTPARVVLRGSSFERCRGSGIAVFGAQALVESTTVRDTQLSADELGNGLHVKANPLSGASATLELRGSLIEMSRGAGVLVRGSGVEVESTVVRGTILDSDEYARGLSVANDDVHGMTSTLELRSSRVEANQEIGVLIWDSQAAIETGWIERNVIGGVAVIGAMATIVSTVVRDTQMTAPGVLGRGVLVQPLPSTGAPAHVELRTSLIEANHEAGVAVISSVADIDACLIRQTEPDSPGYFGDGVLVYSALGRGSASVTNSRITDNARSAIANFGATVQIGSGAFVCNAFGLNGEAVQGEGYAFEDLGGNQCGCPEANEACNVISAGLNPLDEIGSMDP